MKINIHFLILMFIACITALSDIIIYLLGIQYEIALILGLVICCAIFGSIVKKKKIVLESNFEETDIIFYMLLASIFAIRIGVPDFTYDTRNYHIYLQENPFIDKINFDFFVRIEIFNFPLGDRMFYIFRHFLGYRLGTILSYYVCIVIYYQIKLIVKYLKKDIPENILLIISLGAIFIFAINQWIGTYYVDTLSATFVLEMIVLALALKGNNDIEIKYLAYLVAIIVGISVGIKVINLIIEIPVLIYFLKYSRKIRLKDFIICMILIVFPFGIYVIDNIKQTGNPVFPYINTIFKSKFFDLTNYSFSRWGANNFCTSLFWPIVVTIFPQKGYEIPRLENELIFGIGYIWVLIYILKKCIICKEKDNMLFMSVITITMTIFWANGMSGYVRYGIVLIVLYWILSNILFYDKFVHKKINELLIFIPIITVFSSSILFTYDYTSDINRNYTYDNYYNKYFSENYIENLKYLFRDRKNEKIHIDGVWGKFGEDSLAMVLVRDENVPIYNFEKYYLHLNDYTNEMYNERINSEKIYTLIDVAKINRKVMSLNANNFVIAEFIKCYDNLSFANTNNKYYLVRVEYDETQKNELVEEDDKLILNGYELIK